MGHQQWTAQQVQELEQNIYGPQGSQEPPCCEVCGHCHQPGTEHPQQPCGSYLCCIN